MSDPAPDPEGGDPAREGSSQRSSYLVAAGIGLSRIAGLAREAAVASFLGTGPQADAFRAAFRIPNLLQNLLGEGVLSASFIPGFSQLLAEGRERDAAHMARVVGTLLALLTGGFALIGLLLAEPLARLIAFGWIGTPQFDLTVTFMRILFPGIGLLVLSAWCLGILNSHRRFFLSYVAPVLWSAAQIAAVVAAGLAGLGLANIAQALAWGVLVGSAAQLAVQLPRVVRLLGGIPRPSLDLGFPPVRQAIRAFGPIVAGRGVVQLMTYVELALATLLATGAVSAMMLAQPLYMLPIALFGMSVAAAELPELARGRAAADADTQAARDALATRLRDGLARIAFFVAPSILGFVVLGEFIIRLLYERLAFDASDTRLVWFILIGFCVGLLATTSSRLLQNTLYAAGDTRRPAVYAALRMLLAATLGAVLMLQFDRVALMPDGDLALVGELPALGPLDAGLREDPALPRLGALGLAIAAGVSAWLEFGLLRRAVRRRLGVHVRVGGGRLARTWAAVAVAGVVAVAAVLLLGDLPALVGTPLAIVTTGVTYLAAAATLRIDDPLPLRSLWRRARG
ncbi:murein biosynthesis integral membrane protein MurJ [Egibacter rhizosphaerae]|uniref:Probable lipid II flippase MurJ n=1 Tax=Egibacter rhizosphaerae TaxID=1670831 RepID=A0A411YFM0_9ACTN|nr:murein biosynthesis integral membrane protein MurJ [Egibacter rhizosphaerae]QBI20018.1 murein biosynthesis integral membrane protein MurJ [Egibacter rhizosphaerae]